MGTVISLEDTLRAELAENEAFILKQEAAIADVLAPGLFEPTVASYELSKPKLGQMLEYYEKMRAEDPQQWSMTWRTACIDVRAGMDRAREKVDLVKRRNVVIMAYIKHFESSRESGK